MTTTQRGHIAVAEPPASRGPRRHRRILAIAGAALVVLVVLATWLVAVSSVFGVHTVRVTGEHELSEQQVLAAAAVEQGTPLVRLDTDGIRTRVEALPDVASAQVTTSFPSTVTIAITERVAVGVVKAGPGWDLVDETGDQFRRVDARPQQLPLFVVPEGTDARTTGGAVAVVAAALPASVLQRIASIQALDPQAITLVLHDGRVVQWGGADRSADKARVLPALLKRAGSQINLTDPDQPYVR